MLLLFWENHIISVNTFCLFINKKTRCYIIVLSDLYIYFIDYLKKYQLHHIESQAWLHKNRGFNYGQSAKAFRAQQPACVDSPYQNIQCRGRCDGDATSHLCKTEIRDRKRTVRLSSAKLWHCYRSYKKVLSGSDFKFFLSSNNR